MVEEYEQSIVRVIEVEEVSKRPRKCCRNYVAHLFACDNCVLDAIVHPTLILFADIPIALKALDLASKASGKVVTGEILDLSDPTLSL